MRANHDRKDSGATRSPSFGAVSAALGVNLKCARERRGLSVQALAKKANVPVSLI